MDLVLRYEGLRKYVLTGFISRIAASWGLTSTSPFVDLVLP